MEARRGTIVKKVNYKCEYYHKSIGCNLVEPCIFDEEYDAGPWKARFTCPIKEKRIKEKRGEEP